MKEEAGLLCMLRKGLCVVAILQLTAEWEKKPDWQRCEKESSRLRISGKCKGDKVGTKLVCLAKRKRPMCLHCTKLMMRKIGRGQKARPGTL